MRALKVVREAGVRRVIAQGGLEPVSRRPPLRDEPANGYPVTRDDDGLTMLDRVEDVGEAPCRLRGSYRNHEYILSDLVCLCVGDRSQPTPGAARVSAGIVRLVDPHASPPIAGPSHAGQGIACRSGSAVGAGGNDATVRDHPRQYRGGRPAGWARGAAPTCPARLVPVTNDPVVVLTPQGPGVDCPAYRAPGGAATAPRTPFRDVGNAARHTIVKVADATGHATVKVADDVGHAASAAWDSTVGSWFEMAISFGITAATHTGQARALFATLASGSDEPVVLTTLSGLRTQPWKSRHSSQARRRRRCAGDR